MNPRFGAHGETADGHAFHDTVGIAFENGTVHERAPDRLVGVANIYWV